MKVYVNKSLKDAIEAYPELERYYETDNDRGFYLDAAGNRMEISLAYFKAKAIEIIIDCGSKKTKEDLWKEFVPLDTFRKVEKLRELLVKEAYDAYDETEDFVDKLPDREDRCKAERWVKLRPEGVKPKKKIKKKRKYDLSKLDGKYLL